MIDRGLTADGGIHLCEQRGRQLHEVDTALEARGGVPRDVADDASAEGEEARVAMKARVDEAIDDCRERRERLVTFTVRQHERVDLAISQLVLHGLQVQRCDDVVRHDQNLLRRAAVQPRVA